MHKRSRASRGKDDQTCGQSPIKTLTTHLQAVGQVPLAQAQARVVAGAR